jgi:hypothetical protein
VHREYWTAITRQVQTTNTCARRDRTVAINRRDTGLFGLYGRATRVPCIVVTHHPLFYACLGPARKNGNFDHEYASDCDKLLRHQKHQTVGS